MTFFLTVMPPFVIQRGEKGKVPLWRGQRGNEDTFLIGNMCQFDKAPTPDL